MSDLRYAFRQLLKNPGFTLVAVLTLAPGMGRILVKQKGLVERFPPELKTVYLLSLITLCSALLATGAAQEPARTDDRVQGWRGDIDFLQTAVGREHYLFKSRPLPESFRQRAEELKGSIARLSEEQIFAELQRLMATLGDGHGVVDPSPAFLQKTPLQQLPLGFHGFSDGMFVIDANPGHELWIGRRVTHLGLIAIEEALRRVAEYIPKDNIQAARWKGPVFLGYRGPLEALGCVDSKAQEITVGFADADGTASESPIKFTPTSMASLSKLVPSRLSGSPPAPLHLRHLASNYWFEPIPPRGAVYFQFNAVLDSAEGSIQAFSARLDASLRGLRPRLLIVDVRYNGGGNADLLAPLVQALQDFEQRDPQAKLVVITGPFTFSAAQIFISRLDQVTKAVFAGEPSGSKPNFVGEVNPVLLPWSGLVANISNRFHETIPGDTREWIEPEIKVEFSSRDYFANRDPVLQTVLTRYAATEK